MRTAFVLGLIAAMATASASLAQEAAPRQPPEFRLGDAAAPTAYEAQLAIDPRAPDFSAQVRIELRFSRSVPLLWLNATGLDIEAAEFQQGDRKIAVNVVPGGEDFIGFEARGEPFAAGPAVATLRYRGVLEGVSTRGLFRQQENGEWYVVSQFESISARRAFPCFDEPGWKTPWRLTIDAPRSNVVVSNTPQASASDAPGRPGWTRHEFAATKPLPSYLVAFAVGPFDVVDGGTAGAQKTPLRYLAPKGRGAEMRYAKEATPRLLELLEEYFGMPYPFEKLDSVSVPQTVGFGAMENVGMITYGSWIVLATPREETMPFRRRYTAFAAHELAHMWFGNLVTLAWWDDIWLNEAFASWMGERTLSRFRPEWDNGWSVGFARKRAIDADRLASARRVRNPVVAKTDLAGAFDSITYQKGGAVLAMFESWFSPEVFRQGVRQFLERHQWGTATSDDFFQALGDSSGRGRAALQVFSAFVEQPGVPLLDVSLRCEGNAAALAVSQQRLRPVGSSAAEMQWTTPACFRYSGAGSTRTQCNDVGNGSRTLALAEASACPDWILANAGGRSHYVPRYDAALSRQLRARVAELAPHDMVALAVDAAILSESGLMPLTDALAWADALLAHPSPVVRRYAVELVQKQRDAWLTPAEARTKRDIIARRIQTLAQELGWLEKQGESDDLRELRIAVMPYAAETERGTALRMQARQLALAWLANREAVPATMTPPVLETAGRFADPTTYALLEAAAMDARDSLERSRLLSALGKVRDAKLRSRALSVALQKNLHGRDAREFLENALEDEVNRRPALDFIRSHFDRLVEKLPQHSPAYLMVPLGRLCTRDDRNAFAGFFKDRAAQFLGGTLNYRQALERIDLCLAARQAGT